MEKSDSFRDWRRQRHWPGHREGPERRRPNRSCGPECKETDRYHHAVRLGSGLPGCCLADEASIQKLAEFVREKAGRLDILVHSAGTFHMCKIEGTATVDFDRLFHVNVRAPFIITSELLPLLRESEGQIVFINSSARFTPRLTEVFMRRVKVR